MLVTLACAPAAPVSTGSTSRLPAPVTFASVPWEGGPSYYSAFDKAAAWTDPSFFPIGVWFESVLAPKDTEIDKAAGINTYFELTANSSLPLVREAGMHALPSGPNAEAGPETVGWTLTDEPDMWAGPGHGTWTGNSPGQGEVCVGGPCGYTVLKSLLDKLPPDGRLRYANFGKGVMFWETDEQARPFVNDYTTAVSADLYWYTDPNICTSPSEGPAIGVPPSQCRVASNYGRTMDRMRSLDQADGELQPIYALIETGHPFTEADSPTITGEQLAGAVFNSLIHEARGIIYFNHNFGGECISQHVLRDACGAAIRPAVTEVNRRITELAPVLNTQSLVHRFSPDLDTMFKRHDGATYIFAMPGQGSAPGAHTLTLPAGLGGEATVLFENRSIPVVNGTLTDTFTAEHSYHVYKITGG
ncbi:hypothetical protein A4R43_33325 [Amycolatopsis albispora]|uniref:Uncharacterized protein n=1 Tax=Amycolatopsis albispora TaxID=1804986 RepID=A0A344LFA0_9PSEU|nr:hypothetical protein A4R43_33325 [Amycolatopsis albispora]